MLSGECLSEGRGLVAEEACLATFPKPKILYCEVKNVLFFVFVVYYLYEKYYKPITVQSYYSQSC